MKICYFADGRYIHSERWMKYFALRGHEMHLISFAQITEQRRIELERIGVKYYGNTGDFHLKRPWRTLSDLRFVKSILRDQKIDLLHSHYLGANAWMGAVSRFHPHVITVMGGGDVSGPNWKPNTSLQVKYLTPYSLRHADYITSWSHCMAKVVEPYCGGKPIDVVHGGINLNQFTPAPKPNHLLDQLRIPTNSKVVFSPRLMRPLSNIAEFALAAEIVSKAFEHVVFLVATPKTAVDQEYSEMVQRIFTKGNSKGCVRFVSELAHNEIADYFRLADVTVSIPSTDGTPMTVLESMACGTPTVIGDLPDYDAEYFEDEKTTLMVDVKDPGSIASAIIRLLTDQELAERISNEARRRVEETGSYEFQMSKMEAIYQSLIKK